MYGVIDDDTIRTDAGEWKRERCGRCVAGLVASYDIHDMTPDECPTCGGNGSVWVSPGKRLALYPGGPFCGVA